MLISKCSKKQKNIASKLPIWNFFYISINPMTHPTAHRKILNADMDGEYIE